ncbi:MAG: MFS transporter [Pseudomonadota bacterium]
MPNAHKLTPRGIFAASSGNVLEWYDFTVYGFLAPIIGRVFFPQDDVLATTLSAFAVLAVGYLARPIGSVIFGHIGDRMGRKPALLISVILMGFGSVAIGVMPTHEQIGMAAAVLLVAVRIVQGIAVAGEYTSSGILLVESAPPRRRYLAGSWIAFAMMIGCVVGAAVPAIVSSQMSEEMMTSWGWRVPFLIGGVVALTSLILRIGLNESASLEESDTPPVVRAVREHWREMISMIILMIPVAVLYFLVFTYASSFLTEQMHVSTATALDFSTINLVTVAVLIVPAGYLADAIGPRPVLLAAALITLVAVYPFWSMMHASDLTDVFVGQMGFAAINAAGWALSITVLCAMVPMAIRCSAVSIGYNLCMAIFGGTTPFVATYLVSRTSDDFAPVYYLVAATLLSLIVIWRLPRKGAAWPGEAAGASSKAEAA